VRSICFRFYRMIDSTRHPRGTSSAWLMSNNSVKFSGVLLKIWPDSSHPAYRSLGYASYS